MNLLTGIQSLVNNIESLHMNDPRIGDYWDQMIELLSRNEEETIQFLQENADENTVNHIAGNFPEISYNLQSKNFIDVLEKLDKRFPQLKLEGFIKGAREGLLDTDENNN